MRQKALSIDLMDFVTRASDLIELIQDLNGRIIKSMTSAGEAGYVFKVRFSV